MPTIALNDRSVAGLKATDAQVDYFDRALPGFGVRVNPAGRKTFILLHRVNGRLQRLTLRDPKAEGNVSTYPLLTLARARELAREALRGASEGRDVGAERKQARARTFGILADDYLEKHAKRKKRSWREDARLIRAELEPWRHRPVASIRRADVRELLDGIVERGAPVAANRTLALVRKILNFGVDVEWVEANVAAKLAKPAAEQSRDRVLTPEELRSVWTWLEREPDADLDDQAAREHRLNQAALKLRLLTAQRGGEVVQMRWQDVDLESGWWTIPAEHSKNKLPHRVPLSAPAVDLTAKQLQDAGTKDVYVFKGIRGTRQRRKVLDGLEVVNVRPHDFRRTAASMMTGGGIPRLTVAKILNHADSSVTAVYDRHGYDAEKRAALEWWGAKLTAIVGGSEAKVLPFSKVG